MKVFCYMRNQLYFSRPLIISNFKNTMLNKYTCTQIKINFGGKFYVIFFRKSKRNLNHSMLMFKSMLCSVIDKGYVIKSVLCSVSDAGYEMKSV